MIVLVCVGVVIVVGAFLLVALPVEMFGPRLLKEEEPEGTPQQRERLERWRGTIP
jgi:hypothetical protein